jgi:membrane fusion protein (multidrug efflux system)
MTVANLATMRPWLALTALGAGLALAGCRSAAADAKTRPQAPIIKVDTVTVSEHSMPRFITLTGTLTANQEAEVAADVAGKVYSTYVERGTFVARGAPLAVVDARSLALSRSEASAQANALRAQSELAKSDCDRANRLFREGALSRAEFEREGAQCQATGWSKQAADMRARMADKALSDSIIRAPFAGVVTERFVTKGEYVHPDTRVVALSDIDTLRIELSVPESAVANVREGGAVRFRVASFANREFSAAIQYVGVALRRASRDLIVEAAVDNEEHVLRPGMFATAKIEVGTYTAASVPATALRNEDTTRRLFVVKDKHLEERVVETGDSADGSVVVLHGVSLGEKVVRTVKNDVRDGALVD